MCGSSHVRPCFTPRAFPSKQVDGSLSSQPVTPPPHYMTIITLINKNSTWLSNFKYPARYHVPGLCFLLALLSPSIRRYLSIDNTPTPLLIGYPLHAMSTPVLSYTDVNKSDKLPRSKRFSGCPPCLHSSFSIFCSTSYVQCSNYLTSHRPLPIRSGRSKTQDSIRTSPP